MGNILAFAALYVLLAGCTPTDSEVADDVFAEHRKSFSKCTSLRRQADQLFVRWGEENWPDPYPKHPEDPALQRAEALEAQAIECWRDWRTGLAEALEQVPGGRERLEQYTTSVDALWEEKMIKTRADKPPIVLADD